MSQAAASGQAGRKWNFSAGPAAVPEAVLVQARDELLDWHGHGLSVMEMSHRSAAYVGIASKAEQDLRDLLSISDDYAVLFLQGGATAQFAAIPMNLTTSADTVDLVHTGAWAKKAIAEAKKYCKVNVVASSEASNFDRVPEQAQWQRSADAAYLHITSNETIGGVAYPATPDVGDTLLVSDASSTILSGPLDVDRYGVIYAGAQKNIGPAGLTVVIVRRDLLGRARPETPSVLDWQVMADADSMANTPPTLAWYMAGLVFQWLKDQGGVAAMAETNARKAGKLYAAIDNSNFYGNPVLPAHRSLMNVPFTLADDALDKAFLAEAEAAGLLNLKGHRSVGGMRASLYNAVPEAAVDALVGFMADFESRRG